MACARVDLATADAETKLSVRVVEWIDEDRVERTETVFCPFRIASSAVLACRQCQVFARMEGDDETVVCAREPPISLDEAQILIEERRICTGPDSLAARTPIGAITGAHVVCTSGRTRIAEVVSRLAGSSAPGAIVVDDARRPVAFIARDRAWPTSRALAPVGECADEPFIILSEKVSVADALERFIAKRQRAIVTVDADGTATGLALDIEVLQWFARVTHPPPPR